MDEIVRQGRRNKNPTSYRWFSKAFGLVLEGRPFALGVSDNPSGPDSSEETTTGDPKRLWDFPIDCWVAIQVSASEPSSSFTAGAVAAFLIGRLKRQSVKTTVSRPRKKKKTGQLTEQASFLESKGQCHSRCQHQRACQPPNPLQESS